MSEPKVYAIGYLKDTLRRYTNRIKTELESYAKIDEVEGVKTKSLSPVITIDDAAPINTVDLKVDIEPVQDLHGYDKPWVGGAGKNLLPMTVDGIKAANTDGTWNGNTYTLNNITFIILTDSDNNVIGLKVSGSNNGYTNFSLGYNNFKSNTYILSFNVNKTEVGNSLYLSTFGGGSAWASTNYTPTITLDSDTNYQSLIVLHDFNDTDVLCYPMIRLSTESDSTFAPYTNICPISGRSEVNVTRCGVNVWDEEWESGYIDANGVFHSHINSLASKNYIPVKPNTQLYLVTNTYNVLVIFSMMKTNNL